MTLRSALILSFGGAAILGFSPLTPATAGTTVYTDRASFNAALGSGLSSAYTEDFNTNDHVVFTLGPNSFPSTAVYSLNGLNYSVTAPGPSDNELYVKDILSTQSPDSGLKFSFAGSITAVGGNFFTTNFDGDATAGPVKLTLGDGSAVFYTAASSNDFVGFISTSPINALTFAPASQTADANVFSTVDNLTVAAAAPVPEASTGTIFALGLGLLMTALWRKRPAGTLRQAREGR